jgi:lipopolysaccharide transport system ATP-binding protein
LISHFSDRVLLLEKGELLFDGEPKKAIERYMLLLGGDGSQFEKNLSPGNFKSEFLNEISIGLENEKSIETKYLFLLDQVTLKIRFTPKVRLDDLTIGFHIDDEKGVRVFGTNSFLLGEKSLAVHSGKEHQIKFLFPVLFREGKYSLGVSFHKGESHIEGSYFWGESLLDFEVERGSVTKFVGLCHLPTKLEFT